jgi:hypothetical protein
LQRIRAVERAEVAGSIVWLDDLVMKNLVLDMSPGSK